YSGNTIGRAELDGVTGKTQSFVTGASGPAAVAVDGQHIYWGNVHNNTIGRADLDGVTNKNQSFIPDTFTADPEGIAVNAGFIYWTNSTRGTIGRANLDGSNPIRDFIGGASSPFGLAIDGGAFT